MCENESYAGNAKADSRPVSAIYNTIEDFAFAGAMSDHQAFGYNKLGDVQMDNKTYSKEGQYVKLYEMKSPNEEPGRANRQVGEDTRRTSEDYVKPCSLKPPLPPKSFKVKDHSEG